MSCSRLIAIGDIHGCSAALATMIEKIAPGPEDVIVTLGDYVDRGIDSKGVLDQLIELSSRCRLVPLGVELIVVRSAATPAPPFSKTTWQIA